MINGRSRTVKPGFGSGVPDRKASIKIRIQVKRITYPEQYRSERINETMPFPHTHSHLNHNLCNIVAIQSAHLHLLGGDVWQVRLGI